MSALASVGVDPLTDFLDGPRARGAFVLHLQLARPWSVDIADDAPLTLMAVLTGDAWLRPVGHPPTLLHAGDVALVRRGVRYVVADSADREPDVRIGPGQSCTGSGGRDLSDEWGIGPRRWGNDPAGGDTMLVGSYLVGAETGGLLLRALPEVAAVRAVSTPVLDLLVQEAGRTGVAQASVLDRLLDVLLISVVRAWAESAPEGEPNWLTAGRDPLVRDALRLMHARPGDGWTVESLAAAVGTSRAALARRFTQLVGMPPIAYLSQWRLALAADLLQDLTLTLSAVSRRVGYATPFSMSAAFKKQYGVSPQQYRTAHAG